MITRCPGPGRLRRPWLAALRARRRRRPQHPVATVHRRHVRRRGGPGRPADAGSRGAVAAPGLLTRSTSASCTARISTWLDDLGAGLADHISLGHALMELATNVVKHAYRRSDLEGGWVVGHGDRPLRIDAALDETGAVVATVSDSGEWRTPGSGGGPRTDDGRWPGRQPARRADPRGGPSWRSAAAWAVPSSCGRSRPTRRPWPEPPPDGDVHGVRDRAPDRLRPRRRGLRGALPRRSGRGDACGDRGRDRGPDRCHPVGQPWCAVALRPLRPAAPARECAWTSSPPSSRPPGTSWTSSASPRTVIERGILCGPRSQGPQARRPVGCRRAAPAGRAGRRTPRPLRRRAGAGDRSRRWPGRCRGDRPHQRPGRPRPRRR